MRFDAPTLYSAFVLANFAGAMLLGVLSAKDRKTAPAFASSAGLWSVGMVCLAGGSLLDVNDSPLASFQTIFLAKLLLLMGGSFHLAAISSFFKLKLLAKWAGFPSLFWFSLQLIPASMINTLPSAPFATVLGISLSGVLATVCFWQRKPRLLSAKILGTASLFATAPTALSLLIPANSDHPAVTWGWALALVASIAAVICIVTLELDGRHQAANSNANIDKLTGLPTGPRYRACCVEKLSEGKGSTCIFSLIALELAGLEKVDQKYGTALEEQLMRLLGHLCSRSAGGNAVTGRLEGPVFSIFMPGLTQEAAALMSHRIGRQIRKEILGATGGKLKIGIRAGVFTGLTSNSVSKAIELAQGCLIDARLDRSQAIILWDDTKNGTAKRSLYKRPLPSSARKAA